MIVEKIHNKRLKKQGISICSKYKSNDTILERNTDKTKRNDDIQNGICLEKDYYKNNKLLIKVFNFDPRIKYTYMSTNNGENNITCPNCGNTSKENEIEDGCPYCGTNYNIEYSDKSLGTKYHYDRVLQGSNYKTITLVIDIIISAILVITYILKTCRTFNIYDISKIIIGTIIVSLILYYLFYIIDAVAVTLPIKIYKDAQNKKQMKFWKRMESIGIDKKTFYNNVNYELQNYYYGENSENKNIIDYDIIDYISLDEQIVKNKKILVTIKAQIREIVLNQGTISEKIQKRTFTFEKSNEQILDLKAGSNIISCHNCGASIDVTKSKCDYCGTKINGYQQWYLKYDYKS